MKKLSGLIFVLAVIAAGCGGGSVSTNPGGQSQTAQGTFTMFIPDRTAASVSGRTPQFVSPSVTSARLSAQGIADQILNLSATSNNCTSGSTGRTCTVAISAPVGNPSLTLTLYDAANGSGNILGSVTTAVQVTAGQPFSVSFTVNGTIASISIATSGAGACSSPGTPGTATLNVVAKDADGNIITGPGQYAQPITFASSSSAFSVSPNPVTAPGQTVTGSYNGQAFTSPATISATSGSVTGSFQVVVCGSSPTPTPTGASPSPSLTPSPSPTPTVTVTPTSTAVVNETCLSGTPVPIPGTYLLLTTVGTYSPSAGTYGIAGFTAESFWGVFQVTPSATTPIPTSTSSTAAPSPTASSGQQPQYFWIGNYQMTSGNGGCFYLITSQDGSALDTLSGVTGESSASGLSVGIPNINGLSETFTETLQSAGTVSAMTISGMSATSGSGTLSLSSGDTGTISLISRLSFSEARDRKLIEQIRRRSPRL